MRFTQTTEPSSTDRLLVALAHPSLEHAIALFADELASEQRFFGTAAPKLPLSALNCLTTHRGIRLGMMVEQRLIGMSLVEHDGSAIIAVAQRQRRNGVGRELLQAALQRAASGGHERVTFRSSWRSGAFVGLAASIGATVVDHGSGRVDLVFQGDALAPTT